MPQRTIVTTHKGETFTLNFDLPRQPSAIEVSAAAEEAWKRKHLGMSAASLVQPRRSTPSGRRSTRISEALKSGAKLSALDPMIEGMRAGPAEAPPRTNEKRAVEDAVRQLDATVPEWRASRNARDIWKSLYAQHQASGKIDVDSAIKGIATGDYESIVAPIARRRAAKYEEHDVSESFRFPFSIDELVAKVIDSGYEMRYNSGSLAKMSDVDKIVQARLGISAEEFAKRWVKDLYDKGEREKAKELTRKAGFEKSTNWFGKYIAAPSAAVTGAIESAFTALPNYVSKRTEEGHKAQVYNMLFDQGLEHDDIEAVMRDEDLVGAIEGRGKYSGGATMGLQFLASLGTSGGSIPAVAKLLSRTPGRGALAASSAVAKIGTKVPDLYPPALAAIYGDAGVQAIGAATGDAGSKERISKFISDRDPRTPGGAMHLGLDLLVGGTSKGLFKRGRELSKDILTSNKYNGDTKLKEVFANAAQAVEVDLRKIEDLVLSGKNIRVASAAKALGVDEADVRRVVDTLLESGHLEKVKGGYVRASAKAAEEAAVPMVPTEAPVAVATPPEPATTPKIAPTEPTAIITAQPRVEPEGGVALPRELSKAAPNFGYKDQVIKPDFESDLDRVAYILANDAEKGASRSAEKFRDFIEESGLDLDEVIEHGKKVKAALKEEAKRLWELKEQGDNAGTRQLDGVTIKDQGFFDAPEPLPTTADKLRSAAEEAKAKAAELRAQASMPRGQGKGRRGSKIDWGKEIEAAVLEGKAKLYSMAADLGDVLAVKKEAWMAAMRDEHGAEIEPFLGKIWRRLMRAIGAPSRWKKPIGDSEVATPGQIAGAADATGARASITKREALIQRILQGDKPRGKGLDDMVAEAEAWKRSVYREAEANGMDGKAAWERGTDALIASQNVAPRALAGHELSRLVFRQAEAKKELSSLDLRIADARGDKDSIEELLKERAVANERHESVYRAILSSRAPASDALRAFQLAGQMDGENFRRIRVKSNLVQTLKRPLSEAEHSDIDLIFDKMEKEMARTARIKKSMLSRALTTLKGEQDVPGSMVSKRRAELLEEMKQGAGGRMNQNIPVDLLPTAVRYLMNEMRGNVTFRDAIGSTRKALAASGIEAGEDDIIEALSLSGKNLSTESDVIRAIADTRKELDAMLKSFSTIKGEGGATVGKVTIPEDILEVVDQAGFDERLKKIVDKIEELASGAPERKGRVVRDYGSEELNNKMRALEDEARLLNHYWTLRTRLEKLVQDGSIPQVVADGIGKDYDALRLAVQKGQQVKSARQDIELYEDMLKRGVHVTEDIKPERFSRLDLLLEESMRRRAELYRRLSSKTIGFQLKDIRAERNPLIKGGKAASLALKGAWDMSRTLVASIDQSGILTQGGRVAFNPLFAGPWAKSILPGVRSVISDRQAVKAMKGIENSELWRVGRIHGLHLVDIASPAGFHEDVFAQDVLNYLRNANKITKAVSAPLVASDRSLGAFTSTVRYNLFKQMTDLQGGWENITPEQLKLISGWINSLTSRASTDFGKATAEVFGKFYFSGHHFASGFEANFANPLKAANPMNTAAKGIHPKTRIGTAITPLVGLGWLTGTDTIMRATGRGFVEWDPTHPNFLKMVVFPGSYDPSKPPSKDNDPMVSDKAYTVDFFRDVTQWLRLGLLSGTAARTGIEEALGKKPSDVYATAANTLTRRSIGTMNTDGSNANAVSYIDADKMREMPGYKEWINGMREMYGIDPLEDGKLSVRPPEFGEIPYKAWERDTSGFDHKSLGGEFLKRLVLYKLNPPASQLANLAVGDFRGKHTVHPGDLLIPITAQEVVSGKAQSDLLGKFGATDEQEEMIAANMLTAFSNAIGLSNRSDRAQDIEYLLADIKDATSGKIGKRAWFPAAIKEEIDRINEKRVKEGKAPKDKSKKDRVLGAKVSDFMKKIGSKKE